MLVFVKSGVPNVSRQYVSVLSGFQDMFRRERAPQYVLCFCITGSPDLDGTKNLRYVSRYVGFTICFTICLFISPDLDGYRAPKRH